jgi:RimJ/RimL family protein N-acetyltransferase
VLIYGFDGEIALWTARQLGVEGFGPCSAIGVARNGEIVAGVVFHRYSGGDIEVSMAATSPRWATRQTFARIFAYPFIQLGVRRITATTKSGNQPVRAFLEYLGFRLEGTLRRFHEDDDAAVYGLLKEECRWLRFLEECPDNR